MEWISVKDRLPHNSDYVVVIIEDDPQPAVGFYDDDWIVSESHKGSCGEEFYDNNLITHWMPLPAQPNDEDVD